MDISEFLPPASPPPMEDIEEQAISDVGVTTDAVDALSMPNYESPDPNINFDAASHTSPEAEDDEQDPVRHLAHKLTEQLAKFRGCCNDCHQAAECDRTEDPNEHISLAMYLEFAPELGPDILGSATIAHQKDDLAGKLDAATRREMFCGIGSRDEIPRICLREDDGVTDNAGVSFDVDSIIAFPSCLAVAKQGIRWSPTRMTVSDLQSDLHLRSRPVTYFDETGSQHQVHRPVHQTPHYTFGRVVGFEDISLYFLFPNLYREEQKCSRLRDEDFRLWMDGILLPAIYKCYSSAHVQHYPSSYDHSRYNSTARGVETLAQRMHPVAREQQLMYYLPPDALADVWANILATVQESGFQQFQDVTILLQAKNLKVLTKDITWEKMVSRFEGYWAKAIDESYITPDLYLDIGKETCPRQASQVVPWSQLAAEAIDDLTDKRAESLLYRRCCLESYAFQAQDGSTDEANLTIETGKRSLRRAAGLLYSQFYPSVKEVFAAGNVYPFTNTAIETLALDKKLRKTWELVGGGLSHQPAALIKAYLYTKLRCHYALLGSMQKSFGIREEHRISKELFYAIDSRMRSRELHNKRLVVPTDDSSPYYSFTTDTLLRWVRSNINKFCVGFEMKVGGCWQDVRQQPDPRQPNGLRRYEGLGFKRTMEVYGYAWFLDKIDWNTLTFRQPHAAYMMFNNPSMQTAYHARYRQVRDVRIDFIRVDKARQWMQDFSAVPSCLELLEKYLRQLCLCAFRKDVFTHIKSVLRPEHIEAALSGEVPLCYDSVDKVLIERHRPPQLAYGHRLAVKNIDVLFAWLWEWKDGQFERKGWNDKPYRMLYQQSFRAVTTARGKDGARKWRQELKNSFIKSHWMIPYPQSQRFMRKDKETKEFVWWSSFHSGLNCYYARLEKLGSLTQPLPASNIKHHPSNGWTLASGYFTNSHMPYVVQAEQNLLRMSEDELYAKLVDLREQMSADSFQTPAVSTTSIVIEFNISSSNYIRATDKWCPRRREYVSKTFEESDSPGECSIFLRQELEKYELLQHHRRNLRRSRRKRVDIRSNGDSDSDSECIDDGEATSDEESLGVKRQQQAQVVRRIETRMRELIKQHREKEKDWPKAYDYLLKEFNRRLERVE
ncbi:hypothetical protein EDB80DRAFT_768800 [Ilyonectria destructans]|nr:hypothetical protein EDB80DRAFT_768800 [Ilyonectria destructans]